VPLRRNFLAPVRLPPVPSDPPTDPYLDAPDRPFILLRPFVAALKWLFPRTLADKDRQTTTARWVAGIVVVTFALGLGILGVMFAKPIQDAYQNWRAEKLVKEARQLAEDGQFVNAIFKAQEAVVMAPENLSAIRINSEFLTLARRDEALHFLDRLEQAGVATTADRQLRIRALLNVRRNKEAAQVLEKLLETEEPTEALMRLAEEVWGDSQRDSLLLRSLKSYAEQHPDNRDHSFRLARAQVATDIEAEVRAGFRRARELATADDKLGLQALEFLDSFERLPPDEASFLVQRLRNHPLATGSHLVAALKRELQQNPGRRLQLIQEAVAAAPTKSREDLVPLVRWLNEEGQYLQVLMLVPEEQAKSYEPLLLNYLNALTLLKRHEDLQRLVNDPQVTRLLNHSVVAFYQAHLALVTGKPASEVRDALMAARNAADVERRAELLVKIAEYSEARGFYDIAEEAFGSASRIPRTERLGYHGLLRTAEVNGNTEALLAAAREANSRWPDDQAFSERHIYASLLTGRDVELCLDRALSLLEAQPDDPGRRLTAAFAFWRLKDMAAATQYLQQMDLSRLSQSQQIIFAAIARDSPVTNARDVAMTALRGVDPKLRMLPEERALFERAAR
jgi:hypothetical protein